MVSSLNESYDHESFFSQASQPAQLQLLSYENGKPCLKLCVIQPSHHSVVAPQVHLVHKTRLYTVTNKFDISSLSR